MVLAKHVINVECVLVNGRFLPDGYEWDAENVECCIHGIKLRWQCDWCDELEESENEG